MEKVSIFINSKIQKIDNEINKLIRYQIIGLSKIIKHIKVTFLIDFVKISKFLNILEGEFTYDVDLSM